MGQSRTGQMVLNAAGQSAGCKRIGEMSNLPLNPPLPESYIPGSDVLIFSSNPEFVEHHREILLSIGLVPVMAPTLGTALAILRLMLIELVIVDGEAGAGETQSILKLAREDRPSVPVLVVDQSSDPEWGSAVLGMGAADYLGRPAFQDDVVRALLAHCARLGNRLWEPRPN